MTKVFEVIRTMAEAFYGLQEDMPIDRQLEAITEAIDLMRRTPVLLEELQKVSYKRL